MKTTSATSFPGARNLFRFPARFFGALRMAPNFAANDRLKMQSAEAGMWNARPHSGPLPRPAATARRGRGRIVLQFAECPEPVPAGHAAAEIGSCECESLFPGEGQGEGERQTILASAPQGEPFRMKTTSATPNLVPLLGGDRGGLPLTPTQAPISQRRVALIPALLLALLALFSATAITKAQPCLPPPSGLIAWWPGDGNANDQGTNNGTLINGASFGAGKVGQAFSFDGISSCVSIEYSPSLGPLTNYSVTAWVNPSAVFSSQVLLFGQNAVARSQLVLITGNKVRYQFGTGSSFPEVTSLAILPAGEFSHVAGTWDGNALKVYVNGVLDNQAGHATFAAHIWFWRNEYLVHDLHRQPTHVHFRQLHRFVRYRRDKVLSH